MELPKIHCKYDELRAVSTIKPYAKNPNKHSPAQIERLAELYAFHGVRHAIIVDRQRDVVAAGHGRLAAAQHAGFEVFPVSYQEFESEDALYAFVIADNAISLESELDFAMINAELENLGPDLDLSMLGLESFELDPQDRPKKKSRPCPKCGFDPSCDNL